MEFFRS